MIKVAFEVYGYKDTLEDLWAEYNENAKRVLKL